jgi:hypothetical protein
MPRLHCQGQESVLAILIDAATPRSTATPPVIADSWSSAICFGALALTAGPISAL